MVLAGVSVFCFPLQGKASKTDLVTVASDIQKKDPTIVLTQSMAEIVDVEGQIADVMVADPSIVDVSALQSNRLYLVGINLGTTNIIALDEAGNVIKRLNVHVKIDDETIQNALEELFPNEDVHVKSLTDQLILSGTVSTPDVAERVANVVGQYMGEIQDMDGAADEIIVNLLNVRGKAQVMLRVKVMEVSRTLLRERGANTDIDDLGGVFGKNIRNNPHPDMDGIFGGVIETGVTETPYALFGVLESFGALGPIETMISLLEEEGLVKVLAEPNLTAISGEEAGFLAGGEFPVPSGKDSEGNIVITFRQFGVSLNFSPTVLSEKRISLQLQTEVSSLARESQVQLDGVEVPGLDVRRASTTVELGSGGTLMIAGLLESETIKTMSGLPGITRTPILGDLMSSESFRRDETEMVVLVTPYLVDPFADEKQSEEVPKKEQEQSGLASAFSKNIRKTYGALQISDLFEGDKSYGYIID